MSDKSSVPWAKRLLRGLHFTSLNLIAKLPSQHLRRWLLTACGMKIGEGTALYGGAEIRAPKRIRIGRCSVIGGGCLLDGRYGLTIQDHVNISSGVVLLTAQHDHSSRVFAGIGGAIVVEDYVWLGIRSIVLPGVTIAKGCVVAAGAVVTKNTEPFGIYGGVPARRIGERTQDLEYNPAANYVPVI